MNPPRPQSHKCFLDDSHFPAENFDSKQDGGVTNRNKRQKITHDPDSKSETDIENSDVAGEKEMEPETEPETETETETKDETARGTLFVINTEVLESCMEFTHLRDAVQFAQTCKGLRVFVKEWIRRTRKTFMIIAEKISYFVNDLIAALPNLESLVISNVFVSQTTLATILTRFTKLKSLTLIYISTYRPDQQWVSNCIAPDSKLESLVYIIKSIVGEIECSNLLQQLPHLTSLHIKHGGNDSIGILNAVKKYGQGLKKFSLSETASIFQLFNEGTEEEGEAGGRGGGEEKKSTYVLDALPKALEYLYLNNVSVKTFGNSQEVPTKLPNLLAFIWRNSKLNTIDAGVTQITLINSTVVNFFMKCTKLRVFVAEMHHTFDSKMVEECFRSSKSKDLMLVSVGKDDPETPSTAAFSLLLDAETHMARYFSNNLIVVPTHRTDMVKGILGTGIFFGNDMMEMIKEQGVFGHPDTAMAMTRLLRVSQ